MRSGEAIVVSMSNDAEEEGDVDVSALRARDSGRLWPSSSSSSRKKDSSVFSSPRFSAFTTRVLVPFLSKTIACPIEHVKLRNQLLVALKERHGRTVRATKANALSGNEANLLRLVAVQLLDRLCKRPYKQFFRTMFSDIRRRYNNLRSTRQEGVAVEGEGREEGDVWARRKGGRGRRTRRRTRRDEVGTEATRKFWWHFAEWFAVSASSSLTATLLLYPVDTFRTRAAVGLATNPLSFRQIYGKGPGLVASVAGSIVYRTLFFLLYNWSRSNRREAKDGTAEGFHGNRDTYSKEGVAASILRFFSKAARWLLRNPFVLSSLAGVLVFPFDTVRRLKMLDPDLSIRDLTRRYGYSRVLWAGAWENFVRTAVEGGVLRLAMPLLAFLVTSSSSSSS